LPVSLLSLGDQYEFDFRWLATHFSYDPFGTPRATQDKPFGTPQATQGKPFYLFNVAAGRFIRSVAVTAVAPLLRLQAVQPRSPHSQTALADIDWGSYAMRTGDIATSPRVSVAPAPGSTPPPLRWSAAVCGSL
jgi:hypothetical protein